MLLVPAASKNSPEEGFNETKMLIIQENVAPHENVHNIESELVRLPAGCQMTFDKHLESEWFIAMDVIVTSYGQGKG